MVGGGRPVRRAAGSISFRNRRVGPMKRPNRWRNNRHRWLQNLFRRPPPDSLSRGTGHCLDKRKATPRSGLCYWRERLSIAVMAAPTIITVTVLRSVPMPAIVMAAAPVIHRRRIDHWRRRHVHGSRAVVHRRRRRHVYRLRRDIDGRWVDDSRNADRNAHIHARQGDTGDHQPRGANTCNKPFFHLAPARCQTQQS